MTDSNLEVAVDVKPADVQVLCIETNWGDPRYLSCSNIPFLNRPFLHHVVEQLAERGYRNIQFVSDHGTKLYAETLGSGERWGLDFQLQSTPSGRFSTALNSESESDDCDCVPMLSIASHCFPLSTTDDPTKPMIRVDSAKEYIHSQVSVMNGDLPKHLTVERDLGGSVWVGRNVKIHRSVSIDGPVLIGDNARIGAGVQLGPATVIGPNCVIGRNTTVSTATVMPHLYVGESLDIEKSIVFADRIVNVRFDTALRITDNLLVSRI